MALYPETPECSPQTHARHSPNPHKTTPATFRFFVARTSFCLCLGLTRCLFFSEIWFRYLSLSPNEFCMSFPIVSFEFFIVTIFIKQQQLLIPSLHSFLQHTVNSCLFGSKALVVTSSTNSCNK